MATGDREVDGFIDRNLVSFAAWDLLMLLHSLPDLEESAADLSHRLGRPEPDVAEAVATLVSSGILEERERDGGQVCCLSHDVVQRRVLDRFVVAAGDRDTRLDLVRIVLQRTA